MIRLLVPLILGSLGAGAGIGAGIMFGPDPAQEDGQDAGTDQAETASGAGTGTTGTDPETDSQRDTEFARLNNQFIVPVVQGEQVTALVVLSITLEIDPGTTEEVFSKEPRLRDRFLRVLFDHANIGGFDAGYTQASTLSLLRRSLLDAARQTLGELVRDVLIVDIVRQET